MDELKFCLKSLVVALLIVCALQIHIGVDTVENHVHTWLETSPIARYLEKVAGGAGLAVRNGVKSLSDSLNEFAGHALGNNNSQKASRLQLNFERNPAAVAKPKKQNDDDYVD